MHYSIFGEHWWLDAVAGLNNWNEVRVESTGRIEARLPYCISKIYGFIVLTNPPLTPHLGPWFAGDINAKYATNLARQKDLVEELITRLPKHHAFQQNFHHDVTNWLPWFWNGFEQTTRYTYVINDLNNEQELWNKMQSNIRGDIRKAQNRFGLHVRSNLGPDVLLQSCQKTFQRQGIQGLPEDVFRRIYDACEKRSAGRPFFAVDEKGVVHSAAYIVWDERTAYYLVGGGDPALRNSGAQSLVMWEAIRYAAKVSRSFDFEGSMLEPVERFFRAFGAKQVPYHRISRFNSRWLKSGFFASRAIKSLFKK